MMMTVTMTLQIPALSSTQETPHAISSVNPNPSVLSFVGFY
jgi:hypothetical protein